MKTHFTEADLLETYYMKPGESMPVMMHLADCGECASKYERLERKIREAAVCAPEKEESFWVRQRASVMQAVAASRGDRRTYFVPAAAAAVLLAFIAGGVVLQRNESAAPVPATTTIVQQAVVSPTEETRVPSDPWDSQELEEFGSVVQWETWTTDAQQPGDKS
ncbi:MAG: hypothetical protein JJE51_02920 [Thermoanaerobaculia bacterium]|nr:hypothetical protein [Thermoanaerobaculia bacterium]